MCRVASRLQTFSYDEFDYLHGGTGNAVADSSADAQPATLAVLQDLERDAPAPPRAWGAFFSTVTALFTLGILPVVVWNDRFNKFVDQERRKLRRFADWLRVHSNRPETIDLRVAAEDLGCRPLLTGLSIVAVVGVVAMLIRRVMPFDEDIITRLVSSTYDFHAKHWRAPLSAGQQLFAAWGIGLSAAYLFHWVQVRAHVADVRRFVEYANRVLRGSGARIVTPPRAGPSFGMFLFWLIAGILLTSRGAWWGLPMALCGMTQRRYMAYESVRLHRTLAARVREIAQVPVGEENALLMTTLPMPLTYDGRCANARCLAPRPRGARFCPRCGHGLWPGAKPSNLS
jgi:hypothetical protein